MSRKIRTPDNRSFSSAKWYKEPSVVNRHQRVENKTLFQDFRSTHSINFTLKTGVCKKKKLNSVTIKIDQENLLGNADDLTSPIRLKISVTQRFALAGELNKTAWTNADKCVRRILVYVIIANSFAIFPLSPSPTSQLLSFPIPKNTRTARLSPQSSHASSPRKSRDRNWIPTKVWKRFTLRVYCKVRAGIRAEIPRVLLHWSKVKIIFVCFSRPLFLFLES